MPQDSTIQGQNVVKKRHNVTLADDVRQMAEDLAAEDRRSFSNLLEWLVQQEWARRQVGKEVVS